MADIDTTTLAVDLQTLIARNVIAYTMPNLVMAGMFSNVEGDFDIGQNYDMVTLSRIAATAGTVTGPSTTTFSAPTETKARLVINKIYYGAIRDAQIVDAIRTHDFRTLYQASIRDGLKVIVDAQIATLVAGFSQTVGTLATPASDDNIRRAVQYLDDADAPMTDRRGCLSPAEKNDKLSLERWSSSDYSASADVMSNGIFKRQYGIDWAVSTNLTSDTGGHDNIVAHKDAAVFAIRREAGSEKFDFNNPQNLSREIAITVIFGFIEKRDAFGIWIKAQ